MSTHSEAASLDPISESRFSRRPRTETERNWFFSLLVVIGSVLVFAIGYQIEMERGLWNRDIRLVRDPSGTSMRYLALSHFFVALLYMSTSRRYRAIRSWVWFAVSLAIGVFLCLGYARLGIINPIVATTLFFTYFLIHDFRDQVFFYFANGDSGDTPSSFANVLAAAPLVVIGIGVALFTAAAGFGLPGTHPLLRAFGNAAPSLRLSVSVGLLVAAVVGAVAFRAIWMKHRGAEGLRSFVRSHRPILLVLSGSITVLAISAAAGASGDGIILLHVCSWYVFTVSQLRKRVPPVRPAPITWSWMRSTVAGFNFVHLGSLLLFLIAGAIWSYMFRNDPSQTALATVLGREMFGYWTILHVTVSFPSR